MQPEFFQKLDKMVGELVDQSADMTDWEENFVSDIAERFGKYGADTPLSQKQWDKIVQLHEKYCD